MESRWLYVALIVAVALERVVELVIARRNARVALGRGGVLATEDRYGAMVVMHTLFLPACIGEVWALDRPWIPAIGVPMLIVVVFTMALRYWVIRTLGEQWNTRVIRIPGARRIEDGPFRWVRHPNYVAVVLELIALPLVHCAWVTAVVFGVWNAFVLRHRIRVEESAMQRQHGSGLPGGIAS